MHTLAVLGTRFQFHREKAAAVLNSSEIIMSRQSEVFLQGRPLPKQRRQQRRMSEEFGGVCWFINVY